MNRALPSGRKVYVQTSRPDVRVPMREIDVSPSHDRYGGGANPPLRLYDTGGLHTDPEAEVDVRLGLPKLRRPWILERADVEEVPRRNGPPPAGGWPLRPGTSSTSARSRIHGRRSLGKPSRTSTSASGSVWSPPVS